MNAVANATAAINNQAVAVVQYKGVPVVTTAMLAEFYGTDSGRIRNNIARNTDKFIEGKHYFKISGENLKEFASLLERLTNSVEVSPKTRVLTVWTERGAMRHAKLLETDKAWQIFEQLEEGYFRSNQPKQVALPNFLDPAESAIAWAEQYKARQVVEQKLSLAEPKAQAFDNMVNVTGGLTFRTLAKDLNVNENVLRTFLKDRDWMQWIKNNMVTKHRAEQNGWAKTDSVLMTEYDDEGNVKREYMKVTTFFTAKGKAALELAIVQGELKTKDAKSDKGVAA